MQFKLVIVIWMNLGNNPNYLKLNLLCLKYSQCKSTSATLNKNKLMFWSDIKINRIPIYFNLFSNLFTSHQHFSHVLWVACKIILNITMYSCVDVFYILYDCVYCMCSLSASPVVNETINICSSKLWACMKLVKYVIMTLDYWSNSSVKLI